MARKHAYVYRVSTLPNKRNLNTFFFLFLLGYRDIKSSDFEILSLIAKKSQINICKFRKFPDIDVSV